MSKVRIGHISDLHIQDGERAPEIAHVLEVAGNEMRKAKVDRIIITGDIFDSLSSPSERELFANTLDQWLEFSDVDIVRGNHDRLGDLLLFARLKGAHEARVFERSGGYMRRGLYVFALPWFDKSFIAAMCSAGDEDADSLGSKLQQATQTVLNGIRSLAQDAEKTWGNDVIAVLAGHVLVGGSTVSTGQTLIGTTVEVPHHALADAGCEAVLLGHVHKHQTFAGSERVAYAGSPWRLNFGEPEDKGFRLLELERTAGQTKLISANFVQLPARRIELVDIDLTTPAARARFAEDPLHLLAPHLKDCNDSMVRVRYSIAPEHLAAVDQEALARVVKNRGAFQVKTEAIVVHKTRTRAPEIAQAVSPLDKLLVYLKAKGIALEPGQDARLSAKLDEIGGA
jgi:exonuclease SbcD